MLCDRYQIVDKLRFGGYSTVWLALDTHKTQYVAVKLRHEIEVLHKLSNATSSTSRSHPGCPLIIPVLLDKFVVESPNGRHPCYTTVPARYDLSDAAYGYVSPLPVVRALEARIIQALAYIALARIYTWRVLLSGAGEAFAPASHHRQAQDSHTPLGTRPPEAIFEPDSPLSFAADIWSLGLLIWRILGLNSLVRTNSFLNISTFSAPDPTHWRRKEQVEEFASDGRQAILDILHLLRQMLKFVPAERVTAEQVLKSEWTVKWELPVFQRSCLEELIVVWPKNNVAQPNEPDLNSSITTIS
ncbi:protein kinase [Histoplasma capsulatum var. duboisii H88]|uniref:non-specific serine/threonine protein kinase n=1 Tax=Ajellomyces capsulatus (strain H88) TaxID=544711 RepID=F0ULR2_AJEC8|nr:protein kinase [Histoplasma capsulatum var. duboisii H88]